MANADSERTEPSDRGEEKILGTEERLDRSGTSTLSADRVRRCVLAVEAVLPNRTMAFVEVFEGVVVPLTADRAITRARLAVRLVDRRCTFLQQLLENMVMKKEKCGLQLCGALFRGSCTLRQATGFKTRDRGCQTSSKNRTGGFCGSSVRSSVRQFPRYSRVRYAALIDT